MNYRPLRVAKLIQDELMKTIEREVDREAGVIMTITAVTVDKKLEHAEIGVSVVPSDKADSTLRELKKMQGELQHILFKKLNIRPMPRIEFQLDHGYEEAARIEKILLDNDKE